jgi:hypothetical protein
MKRFEIIEDRWGDPVVKVNAAEDARIKREIKTVYKILDGTATKLIEDGTLEGFGFDREIMNAAIKSKKDSEPYIVGRFDARYEPDKPLKFYELNTLYAGGFCDKYEEELGTRRSQLGRAEYVYEYGMKRAWKNVARYTKERAISSVGYLSVAPDVEDARFLDREAAGVIRFSLPKQKIDIVPASCPPDDSFGLCTYLHNCSSNTLLLPAAWNMLLDNKAIWAYAYRFNPGHPNLIPTSFDPQDFLNPNGSLHAYWQKNRTILAKPVYDCQGKGQLLIESLEQAREQKEDSASQIYSAWMPPWVDTEKGVKIELHGYILNGGRSAAYMFASVNENSYYEDIPHFVEVNPSRRHQSTRSESSFEPA